MHDVLDDIFKEIISLHDSKNCHPSAIEMSTSCFASIKSTCGLYKGLPEEYRKVFQDKPKEVVAKLWGIDVVIDEELPEGSFMFVAEGQKRPYGN